MHHPRLKLLNATTQMLTKTFNNSGLFHGKMAGDCLVMNKHWGKTNQEWASGYWWENPQLEQKAMTTGWKEKKATPQEPAHELIQTSVSAHILHIIINRHTSRYLIGYLPVKSTKELLGN